MPSWPMRASSNSSNWVDAEVLEREERLVSHSLRFHSLSRPHAAIDEGDGEHHFRAHSLDGLERLKDRLTRGDDIVDHQDSLSLGEFCSLNELLLAVTLRLLPHGEPSLAGEERDTMGKRVGAHCEPTHCLVVDAGL